MMMMMILSFRSSSIINQAGYIYAVQK